MISVLVGDGQRLLGEALRVSLALEPDFEVLEEQPATGLEAVEAILRRKPDVSLIDYWMAGMEGPAVTRMVLSKAPGRKIVLLGWFHGPAEIQAAGGAGAAAFLSKELRVGDLAAAVRQIARGKPGPRSQTRRRQSTKGQRAWEQLVSLTPREIEIIGQLALCGRPEEAAKELSISPNTMRLHIQHILSKTGARSQVEAIALARKHGLI